MRKIKGMSFYDKPWYNSYRSMMDRCYREKAHNYPRYKCKFEHNPIDREPCEYCSDEYMNSGDHPAFQWAKIPTRADRIRSMTDEELADYLRYYSDSCARYDMDWLDWLKEETK